MGRHYYTNITKKTNNQKKMFSIKLQIFTMYSKQAPARGKVFFNVFNGTNVVVLLSEKAKDSPTVKVIIFQRLKI